MNSNIDRMQRSAYKDCVDMFCPPRNHMRISTKRPPDSADLHSGGFCLIKKSDYVYGENSSDSGKRMEGSRKGCQSGFNLSDEG